MCERDLLLRMVALKKAGLKRKTKKQNKNCLYVAGTPIVASTTTFARFDGVWLTERQKDFGDEVETMVGLLQGRQLVSCEVVVMVVEGR